ncbi:uncharacterized protein PHALS_08618 [Plasmopara halstedii]|uniref:Uncharacterized protein n=1 Tax=Plasmopara halstedii TaxID=4781 RepID=A0A0P1AC74_PLAHL|nr:uncharacterized protein PHALS_08618 [Plasmopara halstedii]CEG38552.1 hypothetical protein PHALS_08618 [Plasmopara halstedii]|eukprot:XP_024574921.1 hypothetical protein PHALS_08618 [Plasmopara halstedii]
MDAFFQKLSSRVLFTPAKLVPAEKTDKLSTPSISRSHMVHPQVMKQPLDLPRGRIAHWDKKREKCNNCQHIYLKTLSKHPGFCSVDCKSNMVYLEKVNCTIRAVQEQCRQKKQQQERLLQQKSSQNVKQQSLGNHELKVVHCDSKTFAEFDIESRILGANNVEWAFSAMY